MADPNPYLDPNFQKELDDLLRLYGENQRDRLKTVTPAPVEPPPPSETWANKFARYGHRAGEVLGEFGHTALQLPTLLGKLPANVEEFTGHQADPVSAKLREGSRWLENKSAAGLEYMREGVREHGGTPLQESKVDTHIPLIDEVSLATPMRFAGTVAAPAPGLPAIPKLLSKSAIKPALEGIAKLGAYGGGLSAAAEIDKPQEQRDWWNVPKGAALGLTAPLLQRGMGMFGKKPLPPGAEHAPGTTPPPTHAPTDLKVHLPEVDELPLAQGAPEPFKPLESGPQPELTHPIGEMPQHVLPLEPESFPPQSRMLHGKPARPEFMGKPEDFRPLEQLPPTEPASGNMGTTRILGKDVELQKVGEVSIPESAPGLPKNPDLHAQQEIAVPPPLVGGKPLIGREPDIASGEAPLFSKAAREPVPEQPSLELPKSEVRMSPGARIMKDFVEQGKPGVPVSPADAPVLQAVLERYNTALSRGIEPATAHEMLAMQTSPQEMDVVRKYLNPVTPGETANPFTTPRHNLPPEVSDEMLRRAEKGIADMEIAGTERGGRYFTEEQGQGGTQTVTGLKSPTAEWYKEVTTGPKKLSMQRVERALEKIKQDEGRDVGTDVQRVKEVLSRDPEFAGSPWGKPVPEGTPPLPHGLEEGIEAPKSREPQAIEKSVNSDMTKNVEQFNQTANILNDERGSINLTLGEGVGPIQKILTARRVAELHPQDFKPVYDHTQQRFEFVNAQKYDLNHLAEPFFRLSESERAQVSAIMRQQRRMGRPVTTPATLQPAVSSLDTMFRSAADLINSVREAKGLPDMPLEDFYVPFSRSGDYLVVMEGPKGQVPRWVSATETLREGESLAKELQAKHPTATITVKSSSGQKGDKPALDFGTLGMLQKAGLLGDQEYEQAIKQFGLPQGFSAHFQKALKTFGEATDITDPVSRYIDGVTNYAGRALYDDTTKQLVSTIKDPQVRQYAEKYQQYINEKPVEFSRLRGATAVYDLALNVGSMVQNASQVPIMGLPVLQSHMGSVTKAANLLRKGFTDVLHPDKPVTIGTHTYKPADLLQMWTRSGDVRPINAQELFGVVKGEQSGVELGSPMIQRMAERGALSPEMAGRIRKPIDFLAGQFEKRYQQFQDVNQALGSTMSYGISRLTGKSPQEATQKAAQAHGILMQGFAWMEEKNRAMALLSGYRAGLEKGQTPQQAFEFARTFSRDVNFDYSPASRAQYFRGMGAPLGLFMTFQTEAIATYSKLLKAQLKNPGVMGKLFGPATTAVLAYMTLGGMKGLPGPVAGFPSLEDIDMYGPKPGAISERLPDWAWHGPASTLTGVDVGSKFKLGARVPFRMGDQGPEFDPSQVAIAQPWYNLGKSMTTLGKSPGDASDWWKFGEGMSPPALRNPIAAARWAGLGPAGALERGAVGTVKGHTPGPDEEGKREFFIPSIKDIAGKALTFTPLELSKQYARGRIESQYRDEEQGLTTETVNAAARHLQKNGPTVPNENLRKLVTEHPNTYRELMKAYGIWQRQPHGSVEQIYRSMQEPKKPAKR